MSAAACHMRTALTRVRTRAGWLPWLTVLLLITATGASADPGRRGGGEHNGRPGRGGDHGPRFHERYPPVYPQPIYVPPPVYYQPQQPPGISLFLPFNLRR